MIHFLTVLVSDVFKRVRWVWLLPGVLLVACQISTPAQTDSATVLPAEDILESGPTITDITATSATLLAESRLSLVCAIAYGTTTEYGSLATDGDMGAGGHADHHPVLTGLEPDTDYHFRFGGLGPDGTLYLSQDHTFHTAPAGDTVARPAGANITAQAVVLEVRTGRGVLTTADSGRTTPSTAISAPSGQVMAMVTTLSSPLTWAGSGASPALASPHAPWEPLRKSAPLW